MTSPLLGIGHLAGISDGLARVVLTSLLFTDLCSWLAGCWLLAAGRWSLRTELVDLKIYKEDKWTRGARFFSIT
jgi:hypothetical protein